MDFYNEADVINNVLPCDGQWQQIKSQAAVAG